MKISSHLFSAIVGLAVSSAAGAQSASPQPPLPTIALTVGIHVVQAEAATTVAQRSKGLMMRPTMPINAGMVFTFEDKGTHCMWMRNTLLPLSVAFIDDDGSIINIEDMAPQTDDSHCALRPVRYALEMNKGWFAKRGIRPGMKIGGLPPRAS